MQRARPFAHLHAIMAAMGALLASANSPAGMAAGRGMSKQEALQHVGGYESHGKRRTKWHVKGGTAAAKRAARKVRNVKRNRLAHRG